MADAPPCVSLIVPNSGMDLVAVTIAQVHDAYVEIFQKGFLKLKPILLTSTEGITIFDISLSTPRPAVPHYFGKNIFGTFHGSPHPGMCTLVRLVTERVA